MNIHRCRFVDYPPSAINALAFSHSSGSEAANQPVRLAVGRANGNIEIWDPRKGTWIHEITLNGGEGRSVEGLAWVSDPDEEDANGFTTHGRLRLFSIGYSSAVTEWNLLTGLPLRQSSGSHSEVWCMAAQPRLAAGKKTVKEGEYTGQDLVAGCADGALVQLTTADDALLFRKYIARASKKNARALSITFQSRDVVVAGFADSSIRVYDIRNGTLLRTMTLGGGGPRGAPKETLVWALESLKDGTIVSGDSNGEVCFWDATTYGQLQRIKAHEADTLCLASSEDGQTVFSGGIDRRTAMYKRVGGDGERKRWAPITQRRFHKHDVKAMARFENSKISLIASGGLDTSPVIIPLREFGKEYHRALSYIPQLPQVASAQRLVVSWWQNDVTVWRLNRRKAQNVDFVYPEDEANYKTMARIALKGEEHISAASISPSGKLLAVATVAETKLFSLQPRKQAHGHDLKIQKITLPISFANKTGARLVQFSADNKWLLLISPDNHIHLVPLTHEAGEASVLPALIPLHRVVRKDGKQNCLNGPWGSYNRTITRAAFSADGRILAVSDLAGHIDTWVLEGHEDPTAPAVDSTAAATNGGDDDPADSDDEESHHHHIIIHGQHWTVSPSAAHLPTLPSPALILSFRPSTSPTPPVQPNGNPGLHPTRSNPHAHSHVLPSASETEDRLLALTASHELLEFHALQGRLTPWSRQNPSTSLPEEFRLQRDRAVGCLWDVETSRERLWLYGSSWLCMFDLAQDLKSSSSAAPLVNGDANATTTALVPTANNKASNKKRKNRTGPSVAEQLRTKRATTGAGSKIPDAELGGGIGARAFKAFSGVDGGDDGGEEVEFAGFDDDMETTGAEDDDSDDDSEEEEDEDDDDDEDEDMMDLDGEEDVDAQALRRFRRGSVDAAAAPADAMDVEVAEDNGLATSSSQKKKKAKKAKATPAFYITNRYRPILGVVPLVSSSAAGNDGFEDDEGGAGVVAVNNNNKAMTKKKQQQQQQQQQRNGSAWGIEVALIERPAWDLELPPRFHSGKEYDR